MANSEVSAGKSATQPTDHGAILAGYLIEDDFCREFGIGRRTARLWRQQRNGPPFVKIGNVILYSKDGARAWLKSRETVPARTRKAG